MPIGSLADVTASRSLLHVGERGLGFVRLSAWPSTPAPSPSGATPAVRACRRRESSCRRESRSTSRSGPVDLDQPEVALPPGDALAVAAALARRLLEGEEILHPLHRIVVAAAEIQRVNQEVDVVAVMAVRVERVGREPLQLVRGRGRERRDRFLDLVALRVDVTRHVQRVRDVGDEPGIPLRRMPRLLGHLAAFVGVNQVVMRAEVRVVLRDDLFEQRDGFHRVGARLLGDRSRSRCRWRGRASTSLRDRRDTRRPACAGRRCTRRRPHPSGRSRAAPPALRCRGARAAVTLSRSAIALAIASRART